MCAVSLSRWGSEPSRRVLGLTHCVELCIVELLITYQYQLYSILYLMFENGPVFDVGFTRVVGTAMYALGLPKDAQTVAGALARHLPLRAEGCSQRLDLCSPPDVSRVSAS